jgi:hypothetical protein
VQPIQRFSFVHARVTFDRKSKQLCIDDQPANASLAMDSLGHSRLCLDGRPTSVQLEADGIKGQYACRHGFLLLVSESATWWDDLQLVLLSDDLRVLDHVVIDYQLDRAKIGEHHPVGPDVLELVFRHRWRVRVLERPRPFPQLNWHVFREHASFTTPRYLWFRRVGFGVAEGGEPGSEPTPRA